MSGLIGTGGKMISRREVNPFDGTKCAYCGKVMQAPRDRGGGFNSDSPTRDRIFPGEWGGTYAMDNVKIVHGQCNVERSAAGHCLGALACAKSVARDRRVSVFVVLAAWALPVASIKNANKEVLVRSGITTTSVLKPFAKLGDLFLER
jgi:hypothetical protein